MDSPDGLQPVTLVQNMKPRREKKSNNFIDLSGDALPDFGTPVTSRRSRKSYGKKGKPYRTDIEREAELRGDPWTRKIEARRVLCGHCNTWVKLRNTTKFCPTPWYIHIEKCIKKSSEELVDWAFRTNKAVVPLSDDGVDSDTGLPRSPKWKPPENYIPPSAKRRPGESEDDYEGEDDLSDSSQHYIKQEEVEAYVSGPFRQYNRQLYPPIIRVPTPPWWPNRSTQEI